LQLSSQSLKPAGDVVIHSGSLHIGALAYQRAGKKLGVTNALCNRKLA
jgi:hypothetical protein